METYEVHLTFKGLFWAVETPTGIAVLLPDGRDPRQLFRQQGDQGTSHRFLGQELGHYSEHYGALEFFIDDWPESEALRPDVLLLTKPEKQPVALAVLDPPGGVAFEVRFSSLSGAAFSLTGSAQSNSPRGKSNDLLVVSEGDFSLDRLPPLTGRPNDDAWSECVGFCWFEAGEVRSKRQSEKAGNALGWQFLTVAQLRDSVAGLAVESEPRLINLDLEVAFTLGTTDALVVEIVSHRAESSKRRQGLPFLPEPAGGEVRHRFELRPSDPKEGLRLWVKNRELSRTLFDSDLDGAPQEVANVLLEADWDHGIFLRLAEANQVTIPALKHGEQSDAGVACGGRSGKTN